AVETLFGVKVAEVRTQNRRGKLRRHRLKVGRTRNWKKAIVALHPEHRIDFGLHQHYGIEVDRRVEREAVKPPTAKGRVQAPREAARVDWPTVPVPIEYRFPRDFDASTVEVHSGVVEVRPTSRRREVRPIHFDVSKHVWQAAAKAIDVVLTAA